jgi:hypothetical protein
MKTARWIVVLLLIVSGASLFLYGQHLEAVEDAYKANCQTTQHACDPFELRRARDRLVGHNAGFWELLGPIGGGILFLAGLLGISELRSDARYEAGKAWLAAERAAQQAATQSKGARTQAHFTPVFLGHDSKAAGSPPEQSL